MVSSSGPPTAVCGPVDEDPDDESFGVRGRDVRGV
jgi:hypothetical protein